MKTLFKVLGIIFGVLFIFGAIVQYNDPDPLLWITLYSLAALASFGFAANKTPKKVLLSLGALFLIGFFMVYPETFEGFEIGQGDIKNIEEAREAFGLLLMATVMFVFGGVSMWYKTSKPAH